MRLFTVSFLYHELNLQAMVSILTEHNGMAYLLKFKPAELNDLFPDGHFRYYGIDGYIDADEYNIHSIRELIDNAGKAIKDKLSTERLYHFY